MLSCSSLAAPDAGTADAGTGLPCPRESTTLRCSGATPYCDELSGVGRCVADGGAQCWYGSDCDGGVDSGVTLHCYAGLDGGFKNVCAAAPTPTNAVALCNPKIVNGDCPGSETCDGQFYGNLACRACSMGRGNCNQVSTDGCEVDLLNDLNNCGACGRACAQIGGTAVCTAGQCVYSCTGGLIDCNRDPSDGCEFQPGAACAPVEQLCSRGTMQCSDVTHTPTCLSDSDGGRNYTPVDAGSGCGDGGTCDVAGRCHCAPGAAVNAPCGPDSTCSPSGLCTQTLQWTTFGKDPIYFNGRTGNELCADAGFARATSAWGYRFYQCTGPNGQGRPIGHNCARYSSDRLRCVQWADYVGRCSPDAVFSRAIEELGDAGDPDFRFFLAPIDYARNGGVDVRMNCQF